MPGGNNTSTQAPVILIQCDWDEVIRRANAAFWIACKYRGQTSFQGKIHSQGLSNEGIPRLTAADGFTVCGISRNTIQVKHDSGNICIFVAPCRIFSGIHSKSRTLEGHVGDVYKCRFFPSGIVILSGGADMQLKIWSAETGQCPVTLRGHTAAVTDMCIVDRGRNIISVSKDGRAKLWSCGEASCIATLVELPTTINSCSLGVANNKLQLAAPEEPPSEHEVGTENKILLLGCEDGTVHCLAVRSRQNLFSVPHCSAVNCVAILSVDYFVVGCQDGQILLYSFQHPSEPLHCWFESNSAGLCLLPFKEDGFFIGKADGTCIYHHLPTRNSNEKLRNIRVQLTGPDCDPVYDLSFDGTYVYTASRDATVRKYDVLKVLPHLESFV
ncbi:proteasomal ATPase-associated factor 1-like isoform X2 [Periplaneta americana]|uniref:proteasomal ATPase-associated factor 1-like isoform X2 n=1 Tax=Periplaneta americana TaxID=6978 RepID=UPI0037E8B54C